MKTADIAQAIQDIVDGSAEKADLTQQQKHAIANMDTFDLPASTSVDAMMLFPKLQAEFHDLRGAPAAALDSYEQECEDEGIKMGYTSY